MAETLKKINYLTEEQYKTAKLNGEIKENEIYLTPEYEALEYSRVLWVNYSPNATSFPAQEITLSDDDYDFFDILYYCYYDVHIVQSARIYKEHTPANMPTTFQYNNRMYGGQRTITRINDKKYSISSVRCNPFNGSGADTTTDWIIPIIVYGGKVQRKSNVTYLPSGEEYENTGIVERGSNSLGSFVKFGDGTLICMGNPSGNSNNSDWWSFCNRTDEGIQVNFPYAFIEPPESVVCSPANYYGLFSIMLAEINKDNFKFTGLRAKNNSGTGWAFRYQAIGKWK